jgi:hypothetical protein
VSNLLHNGCDLALGIEVLWLPPQASSSFLAGLPLVKSVASRPFAEFGRDCVRGNDLGVAVACAESPRECACDASDRQSVDRGTKVSLSRITALKSQAIERCEVRRMEPTEDAAAGLVHHRRVDHDRVNAGNIECESAVCHSPRECRQRSERRLLGRDRFSTGTKQPTSPRVDESHRPRRRRSVI